MNKIPLQCHQGYERMDFQRKVKVRYTFFTLSVDRFNVLHTLNTFEGDKTSGGIYYSKTLQFPVPKFEIY